MSKLDRREFLELGAKTALASALPGLAKAEEWMQGLQNTELNGGSGQAGNNAKSAQSVINLPQGGGAARGIGETFQANPFTGTGNFSVPIATSPGRGGFGPQLSLQYSTGQGNGPFGMGWGLSVPNVSRKTEKGVPKYENADVFLLSGAEDLVKVPESERLENGYHIVRYRPRVEGLFARIECWEGTQGQSIGQSFWKITTKENTTSIYGYTPGARLDHPDRVNIGRTFQWMLELTYDTKGNYIYYGYKPDMLVDLPNEIYESSRQKGQRSYQLYLQKILYGNATPLDAFQFSNVQTLLTSTSQKPDFESSHFFKVVFDYGEHSHKVDIVDKRFNEHIPQDINAPKQDWEYRTDAFSTYRSGFEIRTARICRRVLMFHQVPEFSELTLVRSTDFAYQENPHSGVNTLTTVTQRGYRRVSGVTGEWFQSEEIHLGGYGVKSQMYQIKSLPPLEFEYSTFQPDQQSFKPFKAIDNDFPFTGLRDSNTTLVDVEGTGLTDVLQTGDFGFYYWKNLGNHTFSQRQKIANIPAGLKLEQGGVGFGNMSGGGQADILVHEGSKWGYYSASKKAGWKDFRPYKQYPNFQLNDANVRLVDLTGDGKADVLRSDQRAFVYFPCIGEEGFGAPQYQTRQNDLNEFPDVYFNDPRIRMVDMTGDGLSDMVMVHAGRIDYWPNMGHGKFGKRVTMKNTPLIDFRLDPSRLFLVDIDGSGPADLIYVENNQVRFWFNQSGNGWGQEFSIKGTPSINNLTNVALADMLGNGSTGLLWSGDYSGAGQSPYKYLDFTGGIKPNLMIGMNNNMGSATKVQYQPSTLFYLRDLKAGVEWASSLPMVVHVVEKVEKIDYVSKTKLVTTYAYHHGFYDGEEREFRGFAQVDQEDSEEFTQFANQHLNQVEGGIKNGEHSFHVPAVKTKMWFHTGVFDLQNADATLLCTEPLPSFPLDVHRLFAKNYYQGDPLAKDLPNGILDLQFGKTNQPLPLDLGSLKESYRALRGQMLRQEVYGLDDKPGQSEHPYAVTESNFAVRMLQSKGTNPHAVFFSYPHESLSYHYERNPADPRVAQRLILEVDAYGNVEKEVNLAYPRRPNGAVLPDEQKQYQAVLQQGKFINLDDPNRPNAHYIGVVYETKSFELRNLAEHFNLEQNPRWLTHEDFAQLDQIPELLHHHRNDAGYYKRLLEFSQHFFKNDAHPQAISLECALDLNAPPQRGDDSQFKLPLGHIGDLGLPFESYQAIFSAEWVADLYGATFPEELLLIGGYLKRDGFWWVPSGQQAFQAAFFYQATESADPFGCRTTINFHPHFTLTPQSFTDPLGKLTQAKIDFVTLQAQEMTDPNGVVSRVKFDALGMVVGMGILNQDGSDGDLLSNFNPHREYNAQSFWNLIDKPYEHKPLDVLADATRCQLYDLWITKRNKNPTPPIVYSIARTEHSLGPQTNTGKAQCALMYFDSMGREIQSKIEAEPDPRSNAPRWITSGWKLYNNKGEIVQQFQPFYSETPDYEGEQKIGVSSTLFYDPLGRLVCTMHPNFSYEKVLFNAWEQKKWDVNDTIKLDARNDADVQKLLEKFIASLGSPGYKTWAKHYEESGDPKKIKTVRDTERHADTPTQIFLDSLGRAYLNVQLDGAERFETHTKLDIQGKEEVITDPRGIECFSHQFDMAGRMLRVDSKDAGLKLGLPDITGQPFWSQDANQNVVLMVYDALRRPIETRAQEKGAGPFLRKMKTQYGEEIPDAALARSNYLLGKAWRIYDGGGRLENETYDFKGNPSGANRILSTLKNSQIDWGTSSQVLIGSIAPPDESQLDVSLRFESQFSFDALNRLIRATLPDGTVKLPGYNPSNLLKSLSIIRRGSPTAQQVIRNIHYNAKGQRERIQYNDRLGNHSMTTVYTYEPETYRLETLRTIRQKDQSELQNLHYTYDPAGNITHIHDTAVEKVWYCNQCVEGINYYQYDALYRLTLATGREHIGHTGENAETCRFKKAHNIPLPAPCTDTNALRWYTELYHYDKAGNMILKKHLGNLQTEPCANSENVLWKVDYEYATDSNRIRSSTCESTPYDLDPNGNLLTLKQGCQWDYANQLVEVTLDASGNKVHYQYNAQGMRIRKWNTQTGEERIYLGDYELLYKSGKISCESVHLMDDKQRIAMLDFPANEGPTPTPASGVFRYQLNNHLGSSCVEVDDTADVAIISWEEYLPYGGTAFHSEKDYGLSVKRYRYSGKERDEETGLYYYGARYYAAWMGRWMSCDPIGRKDYENLYVFTKNSPISYMDKKGLDSSSESNELKVKTSDSTPQLDDIPKQIPPSERVSWELDNFPRPEGISARDHVANFLKAYAGKIKEVAARYQIDERAIAGAIAWEALENRGLPFSARAVGVAKIHIKEGYVLKGKPLVEQVEEIGLLPQRTYEDRKKDLENPNEAIEAVGALMSALAAVLERYEYQHPRNNPALLGWAFNSKDLNSLSVHLEKKTTRQFSFDEKMGNWLSQEENLNYLGEIVGRPSKEYSMEVDLKNYEPKPEKPRKENLNAKPN